MTHTLKQRLAEVQSRIKRATGNTDAKHRPVTLVAVSKRHSAEAIIAAHKLGQKDFGENYLQEVLEKISALQAFDITWHFIGPVQSNKTRPLAEHFSWVHTVERLKIAERLAAQRPAHLPPLNICLQVNIDDEASKAGLPAGEVLPLARQIEPLAGLRLRGLMAIPKPVGEPGDDHAFAAMHRLFNEIKATGEFPHWDSLSMGMSGDLELAIANGANIVRIGTDIFGPRAN